ncbi:putative NTE family protein ylbK [Chlamydiales bacterium STE3]|nr:putative NTE family protein ylbK [Chlamydiales bacterium STE3]
MVKARQYIAIFLLSLMLQGCATYCYMPQEIPEPLPPFFVPERIKVALVLGSGGVRGMAHIGVLEELEAANIPIDLIVGCSAGSMVGALYADNPCIEQIKDAVWNVRSSSFLDISLWYCRYGLSRDISMRKAIQNVLQAQTFEELRIPLIIVAADLYSGELVPIGSGDLVKAIQASCSIPFVFVPCEHMGRILVDGGVINPVPVKIAKDLDAELVIAVDLSELLQQTFPTNLFQIATRSAEIAFIWQNDECTREADVIIRPRTCAIGTFNDAMKCQLYYAGKEAAKAAIPAIKERLAQLRADDDENKIKLVQMNAYTPQIYHEKKPPVNVRVTETIEIPK